MPESTVLAAAAVITDRVANLLGGQRGRHVMIKMESGGGQTMCFSA